MTGDSRVFRPDRRELLKIGASASVLVLPGVGSVEPTPGPLVVEFCAGRARPGATVEVEARTEGFSTIAMVGPPAINLQVALVEISATGEASAALQYVDLAPTSNGRWSGRFRVGSAPRQSGEVDSFRLAAVVRAGDDYIVSDVLEVVCTPFLAGL